MYAPHQNATFVPLEVETTVREVPGKNAPRPLPTVSATASQKDGVLNVTLTNVDLKEKAEILIPFEKLSKKAVISGEMLTSASPNDYNDFDNPDKVKTALFKDYKVTKEGLMVTLPPMSIVALAVEI